VRDHAHGIHRLPGDVMERQACRRRFL
jgi:hypothetical protein